MTRQHVILCEGYDDRAFWAGWLLHLGCEDPSGGGRVRVKDAWGETVREGKFLFTTSQGSQVLVHPFGGGGPRRAAAAYIDSHPTKPIGRLVVNLDSDAEEGRSRADAKAVVDGITRDYRDALKEIEIVPIIWQCSDGESPGVPGQQTLERLVSAAITAAYPERGDAVASWLAAEPVAEKTTHKNYGVSYYAKWYAAEHGHGDFYRAVWRDDAIAEQLKSRLEANGAWREVEALVRD